MYKVMGDALGKLDDGSVSYVIQVYLEFIAVRMQGEFSITMGNFSR